MRSAVRSLVCTLLVGLLVLAAGCETPTTDPDQVLRDLLVGKTWTPDPAYEATEPNGTTLYFWAAGTGVEGGSHPFTWTILKGTLTMVSAQKGTDVTPNVSLDAHHLIVTYVGKTLHLVS